MDRILVVDDDDALSDSLELMLASEEYEVLRAPNAEAALERIEATGVEVVLCELRLPGLDGFDLLPQIARRVPDLPVILMSECASEPLAAETRRRGASDFIAKPFSAAEILQKLDRVREHRQSRCSRRLLQSDLLRAVGERPIVAASPPMIELLELLERTAAFKTTTLLTGERGTGKEALARAIHAQSPRRGGPFVVVACSELPETHLASALFGHGKGAFSGAERARSGAFVDAHGGSLFLDEIGALPEPLQVKLLSVIQDEEVRALGESKTRKVDVRVITASARDLTADAEAGRFREDLLSRLSIMHLHVPALRERRQDIPLLVDHCMARFQQTLGYPTARIADDALARLTDYAWPGNLRELENVIERAIILTDGERITLRQLPADVVAARSGDNPSERGDFSLKQTRRTAEAAMIERALSATQGNRTHAAKLLEISHRALLYKIKDYQIRN